MIITCSECSTKFLVPDEALGTAGRKVSCGNCDHVWHQMPQPPEVKKVVEEVRKEQAENLKQAVKNKAEGKAPSLPIVVEQRHAPSWLKAAVVALVMMNFLSFLIFNKEIIGETPFYELIGQYDTSGIKIVNPKLLDPKKEGDKNVYFVSWSVQNTSDETKYLPVRKMVLLDKKFQKMNSVPLDNQMSIRPGQVYDIKPARVSSEGNRGKYLMLEIGNPFDLSLRSN